MLLSQFKLNHFSNYITLWNFNSGILRSRQRIFPIWNALWTLRVQRIATNYDNLIASHAAVNSIMCCRRMHTEYFGNDITFFYWLITCKLTLFYSARSYYTCGRYWNIYSRSNGMKYKVYDLVERYEYIVKEMNFLIQTWTNDPICWKPEFRFNLEKHSFYYRNFLNTVSN